jgi:pimeloyl-ACP methyl ester carboxylesterase
MKNRPRIGHVQTSGWSRLHRKMNLLPVILVPGIMGSRLTDPKSGALVWNPLGEPLGSCAGHFAVDYNRLRQVSAPLVPDESNKYEDEAQNTAKAAIKNYFHLIADKYDPLIDAVLALDTHPLFDEHDYRVAMYCCGYDWRQDNAKSGLRLAAVVDQALRETGAAKVILIGHSMGCTIARYYCRVLGGERQVHRLILLGSPTLGAPPAYNYLKIGPPGTYVKDIKTALQEGNEQAAVFELMRHGGTAMQALTNVTTLKGGVATQILGDIYLALCLGAGRWLSRRETTFFARQMPALYQLLPTTILCRERPNWLVFDPLATGYAPTGFMVVLPTLFQAFTEVLAASADAFSGASQKVGDELRDEVAGFLDPGAAIHTSSRAKRNALTIAELFALLGSSDTEFAMVIDLLKDFFNRVTKQMYLDCRNNDRLYRDIYTGFLDHVEMRAVSAGNLHLGLRLEQALTVRHRFEEAASVLTLVEKLFAPVAANPMFKDLVGNLELFGLKIADAIVPDEDLVKKGTSREAEREAEIKKERAEEPFTKKQEEDAKKKELPRAYMPPQTVNIYCEDLAVEGGGILFPMAVISNDDSNTVTYELLPNLFATMIGFFFDVDMDDTFFGDGTVPACSVNPKPEFMSSPFLTNVKVSKIPHASMCEDATVTKAVTDAIAASLPPLMEGRLGIDYAPTPSQFGGWGES